MSDADILVVGAGPTGLTAAIELRRLGLRARLIDKSMQPAEWSQALGVQARTLEQLERYGLADAAVARGRPLRRGRIFAHGREIAHIDFERARSRYPFVLLLAQSETERLLADHLAAIGGATVDRGVELASFTQDEGGVTAHLRDESRAWTERFDWLVGADGAHSAVREQLGVRFSGASVHLGFILGDLTLEGADLPSDDLVVHFAEGDVLFIGPLTGTTFRVIHASHDLIGREPAADVKLADFDRAFDKAGLNVRATGATWTTPFHVNDRQAERYRVGRAFLVGDAAHIHSPVGGQGMNTGMQDAANLAWKLAAVGRGASRSLLASYEEERAAVGRALLQRTGVGLRLGTTTNPVVRWLRDHVAPYALHSAYLQDAAVGFVTETAIQYRHSSISVDHGGAGSLHAGDRVPNPALPGGGRLLDPLAGGVPLLLAVGVRGEDLPPQTPHLSVAAVDAGKSAELAALFGRKAAVFVVRPDGYLGYRSPAGPRAPLDRYLARVGALGA